MKKTRMKLAKKNKKSQFYIITAIFLCSMVFLLNVRTERVPESTIDFASIYSNFVDEAKHAVNTAIYLNSNLSDDFSNFAGEYLEFAETEGINARLFYAISHENRLYMGNELREPANITTSTINFILTDGNRSAIARKTWFTAEIGGTKYLFNTTRNATELKIVMKMSYENMTEVRAYG